MTQEDIDHAIGEIRYLSATIKVTDMQYAEAIVYRVLPLSTKVNASH